MEAVGGAGGVPPWFWGEEAAGRARAGLRYLVRSSRLGGHAGAKQRTAKGQYGLLIYWKMVSRNKTKMIWENGR
jgi:hypothetical protein